MKIVNVIINDIKNYLNIVKVRYKRRFKEILLLFYIFIPKISYSKINIPFINMNNLSLSYLLILQ